MVRPLFPSSRPTHTLQSFRKLRTAHTRTREVALSAQRPIIEFDTNPDGVACGANAVSALRQELRGISLRLPREFSFAEAVASDPTANDAALPVVMLDAGRLPAPKITGITHHDRAAAAILSGWLDLALARGAEMLVLPAAKVNAAGPGAVSYADALSQLYRLLCAARHAAEERGVMILIDAPGERFLLSPVETADLLARVASPLLGARLTLSAFRGIGDPVDWISELGSHVKAIRTRASCEESDWTEIAAALDAQRFDGSLVMKPDACSPDSIGIWRSVGLWP